MHRSAKITKHRNRSFQIAGVYFPSSSLFTQRGIKNKRKKNCFWINSINFFDQIGIFFNNKPYIMKLEHRCFSGKTFRPQPEVLLNENLQMVAIATPWGPDFQTQKILEFLVQNYESCFADEEKTSVYPKLKSLSAEENVLRSLILSCNEWIFEEQNGGKEYNFGYELVCGNFKNGKFIFLQAGHPFIYLDRPNIPLQSLGHILDFSALFSQNGKRLPPLPSTLMGIHPDTDFSIFSFPVIPEDRLIFISRDFVSGSILDIPRPNRNLDHLLSILIEENEESPLWLGILSF